MTAPRALILDYGNVLTWPQAPDIVEAMASRVGAPVGAFVNAYWEFRAGYDAGEYAGPEYWPRVLRRLGRPDGDGSALIDWLIARDVESWLCYREEMWDLVTEVRARGVRTALLSNAGPELATRLRAEGRTDAAFDAAIFSYELRCVKPDPRIYQACLSRLGVEPSRALFVDDRVENVAGAAALEMRAVHFVGEHAVAELRAAIAALERSP